MSCDGISFLVVYLAGLVIGFFAGRYVVGESERPQRPDDEL